jgi:hypothetical protein
VKRFALGLFYAAIAYVLTALVAYLAVLQLSNNTHDRSLEAAMTSVFVFGPIGAVLAFVVGIVRGGRDRAGPPGH